MAECATPAEAVKSLKQLDVDVILVDIGIAKDFIPWAQKVRYPGKSLVIARDVDARGSAIVLKYGASGNSRRRIPRPGCCRRFVSWPAGRRGWIRKCCSFLPSGTRTLKPGGKAFSHL